MLGEPPKLGVRGPPSKLQKQVEALRKLPKAKQKLAEQMLEAIILQAEKEEDLHAS